MSKKYKVHKDFQGIKCYKVMKYDEVHNEFQYKTGLNIDCLPFEPNGTCRPGGLYFTTVTHILEFLYMGYWIREVIVPEDAKVYKDPDTPTKWKSDKLVLKKRRKINSKLIEKLINEGADPTADNYKSFSSLRLNESNYNIFKIFIRSSHTIPLNVYKITLKAENSKYLLYLIKNHINNLDEKDRRALASYFIKYGSDNKTIFISLLNSLVHYDRINYFQLMKDILAYGKTSLFTILINYCSDSICLNGYYGNISYRSLQNYNVVKFLLNRTANLMDEVFLINLIRENSHDKRIRKLIKSSLENKLNSLSYIIQKNINLEI